MQKFSHWSRLAAPTLIHPPSPHRYSPIGWNDSPNRRPQRPFTAPVCVYIVSDHWWAWAIDSMAADVDELTLAGAGGVRSRAAWAPTASVAPAR